MASGLTSLNSTGTDCSAAEGGIIRSYGCKLADISSVTVTSNVISNFTMASTGLWKEYKYDRDATANFNQAGALNGNKFSVEQTAFMKFKGITSAYILAANTAKDCCDVVFIHVLASGTKVVQGLEFLAATGSPEPSINRSTRIVPTINSDTSANEARMEFSIAGSTNTFSQTTSLTDAAILAL